MTDNHGMVSATIVKGIEEKYVALFGALDERTRRLWAASEAMALGHGGVSAVSRATGLAESTIRAGRWELQKKKSVGPGFSSWTLANEHRWPPARIIPSLPPAATASLQFLKIVVLVHAHVWGFG